MGGSRGRAHVDQPVVGGGAARRGGWTVRSHLLAIAAAVLVVFLVAGSVATRQVLQGARRNAATEARDLAGLAAGVVSDNVAAGIDQVVPLAHHPNVGGLVTDPGRCRLDFTLDLFPGSRVDVVEPDGRIVCSSSDDLPADASHHGVPWLRTVRNGPPPVESGAVFDGPTGLVTAVFAAPVRDGRGDVVGAVALVLPTAPVADRLAQVFGGPRGFQFALVDGRTGSLLASSTDLDGLRPGDVDGLDPMASAGLISRAAPVGGTSWRVTAGIDPAAALGAAHSALLRGAAVGAVVLAVLFVSLYVVHRRIARPLRHLTTIVGGTRADAEALSSLRGPAEVVGLASSFRVAIAAHETYEDQLLHQALHDPLTGLPNRALLAERLTHSLEQSARSGAGVAVLFLDLDGFKLLNEGLGHAVGDQVLTAIAGRLRDILRPGDTLARFGGDEFVVVAEAIEDQAQAERLAGRLLAVVQTPVDVGRDVVRVSASIGIAISDPSSSGPDLISDADNAMYAAKERGRSRHEVFTASLRDRVTTRLTVANELRGAVERNGLHLVYQPQIDLVTGAAVGVEALLRWDHPGMGAIPPATFIPIAEDTGSILPIGRHVLEQACRQAARWHDRGLDLTVSVNLSGRQLAEPELVGHVAEVLAETGVESSRLCLELTESVLMSDTPRAAEALAELHDLGVQLSIDDFGTGYSSLAYLHRFPVDHLKIDRAFVQGMTERPGQRSLVSAMVAMGGALGLQVVAEGVETVQQADDLRALGCPTAQGYLFARPQAAEALDPLLVRTARPSTPTGA